MKKTITVTPINRGKANEFIFNLVEQYNTGEVVPFKYDFLTSVVMYGTLNLINMTMDHDNDTVTIRENGKQTMTLHFKEVHELKEENSLHPIFQNIIDMTFGKPAPEKDITEDFQKDLNQSFLS